MQTATLERPVASFTREALLRHIADAERDAAEFIEARHYTLATCRRQDAVWLRRRLMGVPA